MIENVVWNLGGRSDNNATASIFYNAERGTTVYSGRPTTWIGKVGLIYPSDYGYAVLADSCARNIKLVDYDSSACAGNNWLRLGSYEWTLTHSTSYKYSVFYISTAGSMDTNNVIGTYSVRPSIYLKSNIAITGGDGSRDFPYIIK